MQTVSYAQRQERLIYEDNFDEGSNWQERWTLEGLGKIDTSEGRLEIQSQYQHIWQEAWDNGELAEALVKKESLANNGGPAHSIHNAIHARSREQVEKDGHDWATYQGGHIVLWNKAVELPENYRLVYTFRALSPMGLHVLFLNGKGINGEDIFDESLKPRNGIYKNYIRGDIRNYGVSLFANNPIFEPFRGTCNLRKNYGNATAVVQTGPDYVTLDEAGYGKDPKDFNAHVVEVIKDGPVITLKIDGEESFRWQDEGEVMTLTPIKYTPDKVIDTGPPLSGGRFGLRQMVHLHAWYDDIRLYELLD